MKKFLLFAAFLLIAGVSVQAQSETKKSCDKPCTHTEKASASVEETVSPAITAAKKAENIEVKTCEHSGNVSFYRKDVCENSGKVSYTEVEYMESTGEFAAKAENVEKTAEAPKAEMKKSSCSSSSAKASKSGCCSSKAGKASASASSCGSKTGAKAVSAKSGCCSSKGSKPGKSCSSKS